MAPSWFSCIALFLVSAGLAGSAQESSEASSLVQQLAQFRAAIAPGVQGNTGLPSPTEQRREAIFIKLRALAEAAVPALQRGLTDADVQLRRNVALYLSWEGGNYAKHAATPLDVRPFLPQLVNAMRDDDERVKELVAYSPRSATIGWTFIARRAGK